MSIREGTTPQSTKNTWTRATSGLHHSSKTKCAKASSHNPSLTAYPPPSFNNCNHHLTPVRITTPTHPRFGAKAEDWTPSLAVVNYLKKPFLVLVLALKGKSYPTSCRERKQCLGSASAPQQSLSSVPLACFSTSFDTIHLHQLPAKRVGYPLSTAHGTLTTVNVLHECTYVFYSIIFFVNSTRSIGFPKGVAGEVCFYRGHRASR